MHHSRQWTSLIVQQERKPAIADHFFYDKKSYGSEIVWQDYKPEARKGNSDQEVKFDIIQASRNTQSSQQAFDSSFMVDQEHIRLNGRRDKAAFETASDAVWGPTTHACSLIQAVLSQLSYNPPYI